MLRNATSSMNDWLRLGACLALSAGLHAALGAAAWAPRDAAPAAAPQLTVALVEVPAAPLPIPAPRLQPSVFQQPATSNQRPLSNPQPPVLQQPTTSNQQPAAAVCIEPPSVPDATVEASPPSPGPLLASLQPPAASPNPSATSNQQPATASPSASNQQPATSNHQLPRYAANPLPDYPRLARQNRWEGTVRLRANVSAAGTVDAVTLEQSCGHPVLDRAALTGVRRWRFHPASRNGLPVPCEVSIPVAFRLEEGR